MTHKDQLHVTELHRKYSEMLGLCKSPGADCCLHWFESNYLAMLVLQYADQWLNYCFFFVKGDEILIKEQQFTMTPLQLHCVTSRLGMAAPTCGMIT